MNFTQAIQSGLKNYANFQGRSSRSEYWWWWLFTFIVGFAIGFVGGIFKGAGVSSIAVIFNVLSIIFALGTILPSLAVFVRRMHDTGRSGWWYFIAFTIIGIIPLLIWLCTPGESATNKYGSNPLGMSVVNTFE